MTDTVADPPAKRRGPIACLSCRRAKNKCIPQPSGGICSRCAYHDLECVFEKIAKPVDDSAASWKYQVDKRFEEIQAGQQELRDMIGSLLVQVKALSRTGPGDPEEEHPALPGFRPPWLAFGQYGLLPRRQAGLSPGASHHGLFGSSGRDAESEDDFDAPYLIIDSLTSAARDDTAGNGDSHLDAEQYTRAVFDMGVTCNDGTIGATGQTRGRDAIELDVQGRARKKRKADPPPVRKPFRDIVTKRLIDADEGRLLWDTFFSGCHWFVPLWDMQYDQYDSFRDRSPFGTNSIFAVAARIRSAGGPMGRAFFLALEEAQGIARSTLFGPVIRKESVLAMLVLSIWSKSGWLPCGHAARMAMEINLHHALGLMLENGASRSEAEDRDIVVSGRIWLAVYLFEQRFSIDNGKPITLREPSLSANAQALLNHRFAAETDVRLVSAVELIKIRVDIIDQLNMARVGDLSLVISCCRRLLVDIKRWYDQWRSRHLVRFSATHILLALLELEYCNAELWTVCVALRGCNWRELSSSARETAFTGKLAAQRYLAIFTTSEEFIRHLKYATREPLVAACFASVYLLRLAIIYPASFDLPELSVSVEKAIQLLLSECHAERYALAVQIILAQFKRRTTPTGDLFTWNSAPDPSSTSGQALFPDLTFSQPDPSSNTGGMQPGLQIDWDLFGDPSTDPGFVWQCAMPAVASSQMNGSLQPTNLREPFEGWGLSSASSTSMLDDNILNQWLYDFPDTGDRGGVAW